MKKFFLLSLLLLAPMAYAEDHRAQWSAGGGLGANFPAPWAKGNFTSTVDPKLPHVASWLRYNYGSPEVSWEISYNYLALAKQNIRTHAVIFQWISRMLPESILHPHFGFGIGWSKSENFYQTDSWDTPIFQLRAGLDYELRPDLDLSFYLDHFTVFRNNPGEPNMHVLAPTIALTKYFGTNLQLPRNSPSPESTAPATPPPPAASAAPVFAAPQAPAGKAPTANNKKKKKRRKGPRRVEHGTP